ncbi:MAG: hypothetical protein KF912_10090 [Phycisphaeraceae bacterium]|nr:hypothetical protein [Phycisphaeraceae bacterium]MBX3367646.1 hypothetical protein [Phycisphaeraceae bacterium]
MNRSIRNVIALAAITAIAGIASAQATPFRGTHIGFDTATGTPGEQLLLKTGYGTSGAPESEAWAFRFENAELGGQLQTRTARHAVDPNAPFDIARYNLRFAAPATRAASEGGGASPVAGWYAQSSITSNPVTERQTFNATGADAFVSAGRLDGGSFAYEIMEIDAISGFSGAKFAIGRMETSGITDDSQRRLLTTTSGFDTFGIINPNIAGGGTLENRSIFLGWGNHFHGWGFFVSHKGIYEITMRAYDVNGVYAASEPFTFQINSVPAPGALATLALAGLAGTRRRR